MKSILTHFRSMPAHSKVLCLIYAVALIVVAMVVTSESAHAQSGTIYSSQQAQLAGSVYEAVVLQVSIKEVEAATPVRAAGAGLGAAAGLLLAGSVNPQHRVAANSMGLLLGGLLGERSANATMTTPAQEVIVRFSLPNGLVRTAVIVQPAPFQRIFAHEAVYVTEVRGAYRVLKRTL